MPNGESARLLVGLSRHQRFEAAYGWGWLVEPLEDYGFDPHLVHPLRCKAIASARLKMSSTGVPIEEIARLAGHTSTRTTEIAYRRELRPIPSAPR